MCSQMVFAVFRAQVCRQRLGRVLLHSLDELFQPLDTTDSHYRRVRFRQKLLKVISAGPPRATSSVVVDTVRHDLPFTPLRTPPRTPLTSCKKSTVCCLLSCEPKVPALCFAGDLLPTRTTVSAFSPSANITYLHRRLPLPRSRPHKPPTRLAEILPEEPAAVGAFDAASAGNGGVWWYMESTAPSRQDHQPCGRRQLIAIRM
jgi:hypothetical protein